MSFPLVNQFRFRQRTPPLEFMEIYVPVPKIFFRTEEEWFDMSVIRNFCNNCKGFIFNLFVSLPKGTLLRIYFDLGVNPEFRSEHLGDALFNALGAV